jgi:hypothetical protein
MQNVNKDSVILKKFRKHITIGLVGFVLTFLFVNYPAPSDRILNIQNYLITVGGIISAFVIAYLSAKIFSIKTDRDNRQIKIDKLGERLTAFRQLLYFVMKSHDFWAKYNDIAKFKKKYHGMNYERLRASGDDELKRKFWMEETEISHNTISLYTAMEAIYGDTEQVMIPWAYDKAIIIKYTIDDLSKYYEPSNQIWYYLEGRYSKHGRGLFNDTGLMPLYTQNFRELLPKADIKHKGKDFHRELLADLGSEFYEFVIPKMAGLINENTGIPLGLLKTFYSLLAIMLFGVLLPIILQSLLVSDCLNISLTLLLVNLTTLSLLNFLFEFYDLINEELHPIKRRS